MSGVSLCLAGNIERGADLLLSHAAWNRALDNAVQVETINIIF
jgi:hypothetical protein